MPHFVYSLYACLANLNEKGDQLYNGGYVLLSNSFLFHMSRHYLEEYGRHLSRIATTLFEAMVKNLNLGPKQSESSIDESTGFIRVYRYPSGSWADEAWGMMEHTDSSVLSIVKQDQVGGLEFSKDNEWLLVNPIPGTLVVNIGDMLQVYKINLQSFFLFFSLFFLNAYGVHSIYISFWFLI